MALKVSNSQAITGWEPTRVSTMNNTEQQNNGWTRTDAQKETSSKTHTSKSQRYAKTKWVGNAMCKIPVARESYTLNNNSRKWWQCQRQQRTLMRWGAKKCQYRPSSSKKTTENEKCLAIPPTRESVQNGRGVEKSQCRELLLEEASARAKTRTC